MLILITIALFLFIPLVMLVLHLVRPRLNYQGFLAVLAVLAGWVLVFLARPATPRVITLLQWQPNALFTLSPSLLVDQVSWYFSLALASLALTAVITSIAQLGQSVVVDPGTSQPAGSLPDNPASLAASPIQPAEESPGIQPPKGWVLWASILALAGVGLLAATSGNLLTLLLSWVGLDLLELVALLGQVMVSQTRERIIQAFSARMAAVCLVIAACIVLWSAGTSMTFDSITQPAGLLLLVAAGLRLGVLPIHLPFTRGLAINRNLGMVLSLVPASSSYILLARLSNVALSSAITPYLLGLSILAGIYAAINWLRAKDEVIGRPFWLLATASLVVTAALLKQPAACLVWGIASLLSGGLVFSMALRHKNLLPLSILAVIGLSSLPFTPTWQGTYMVDPASMTGMNPSIFAVFSFSLLVLQAFLVAGLIRQVFRGIFPVTAVIALHTERWVWFLYPLGLTLVLVTQYLIGWFTLPSLHEVPLTGWFVGVVVIIFVGAIHYFSRNFSSLFQPRLNPNLRSAWDRLFSLDWLYRFLWRLYRTVSRVFSLISSVLEGDGGLLWALVLLGLIFVFLQRLNTNGN